jgi:hypothetical protein
MIAGPGMARGAARLCSWACKSTARNREPSSRQIALTYVMFTMI